MNPLRDLIRKQIARQGVIPFEKFMELALYCPELGYYERPTASVGRTGDFVTSVSVGCIFGELLAFQFARWLDAIPGPVQLVEAGAHDGRLALDILKYLRSWHPAVFARLELWLLEPSEVRRHAQAEMLKDFAGRVRWFGSWREVPARVRGITYSNELLDAFPFRRLGWSAARQAWFEWGVRGTEGGFAWAPMELPRDGDALLRQSGFDIPASLQAVLPDEFTVECSTAAQAWWREAAQCLGAGRLLTIDYGAEPAELLRPERPRGTLRAYSRQRHADDPLAAPGEQDLTAHVNFGAIRAAGEAAGLATLAYSLQSEFLTRIAEHAWLPGAPFENWTPTRRRQFQTLTHPEQMGRAFRVLIQGRGVDGAPGIE